MDRNKILVTVAFFVFVVISEVILILYTHKASNTYSPLKLPYENSLNIKAIIPEAWGFFSKNPREPKYYLYKKFSDGWEKVSLGSNSRPANFFGLDRRSRAQGVEYGMLLVKLKSAEWDSCRTDSLLEACLNSADAANNLKNISPNPTLCDSVGIVSKEVVPWSWAKEDGEIDIPSKVIKLLVSCS